MTAMGAPEAVADPPAHDASDGRGRWPTSYLGLALALVGIGLALTPSLLPRPWLFQGLIAGIAGAICYGIGVLASWAWRRAGAPKPSSRAKLVAWRALAVGGSLAFVAEITLGGVAQNNVRALIGEPAAPPLHAVGTGAATIGVALLLVRAARGVGNLIRRLTRVIGRRVPAPLAAALALVLVALLGYGLAAGVIVNLFLAGADAVYAAKNHGTPEGVGQPAAPTRSGSPESLVPWDSLGYEGRAFVGRGPSAEQIEEFAGEPAEDPIRVFVGVDTAATIEERAQLAVQELERTGAFDRSVLVVAGATGTGWLESQSMDSIEYMWAGDTAIASVQYSVLPSWISFLVDVDRASEAGRALFEAVHAKWAALPEDARPKLVPYGLSMGSFAAQAPFSGVADLADRTDGALFMGTPNFTEPWASITADRDPGSPEWQPVHERGSTVRWAAAEGDVAGLGPWASPRVLYMQHASDPVVWWSFDLVGSRPDWLAETRGPDVSPDTRWFPVITFLQVTVDQFFGVSVPPGHGHNYVDTIVYAWANVVPPPGWTTQRSAGLQALIDGVPPA